MCSYIIVCKVFFKLERIKLMAERIVYKNRKRKSLWFKILIGIVVFILIGVIAGALFISAQLNKLNQVDTSAKSKNVIKTEKVEKVDFYIDDTVAKNLEGYTNIALLGIDARKGEKAEDCRTDAIIIVTIEEATGKISLTSVARDTYLQMESENGEQILDKATHAHVFGGPVNTVRMLNQSLDLNIEQYAVLNWNSVVNLVDAVGGITVDVKSNEIYDLNKHGPTTAKNTDKTWTPVNNTGEQQFDGVQAATYCRIRKNSGGDQGRTKRMKQVMSAVFDNVKKNPALVTKVTDEVFPQITTNMTNWDILLLTKDMLKYSIDNSVSYPYNNWGGIYNGVWYAVPTTLEDNNKQLYADLFGINDYVMSEKSQEINDKIINNTGIMYGSEQPQDDKYEKFVEEEPVVQETQTEIQEN